MTQPSLKSLGVLTQYNKLSNEDSQVDFHIYSEQKVFHWNARKQINEKTITVISEDVYESLYELYYGSSTGIDKENIVDKLKKEHEDVLHEILQVTDIVTDNMLREEY